MDVSHCSTALSKALASLSDLPQELDEICRSGNNAQYLNVLSHFALNPQYTAIIFTTHEPLFVEFCSRWCLDQASDDLLALAALARILPVAPHLEVFARNLLSRKRSVLALLSSQSVTALSELPLETLDTLLLALCRLLSFDNETFALGISPAQLQMLLHHANLSIRYLAIRVLCLYTYAPDAMLISMVKRHIGECEITGPWEDEIIDYTFFSMWEKKRLNELSQSLSECTDTCPCPEPPSTDIPGQKFIGTQDFSDTVSCIGGVLIPRIDGKNAGNSTLSMTRTTWKNMHALGECLKTTQPLLVSGGCGVGKTLMINEIAKELGKSSSMITLHLNEQTDSKLLLGMYTSAQTPGSFNWQPGVLTTAVKEGHWVFIEDLDRAPPEVISTLLPLLERRELLVPNLGESIRAAPGFKLLASMRSNLTSSGQEILPTSGMIGLRHWRHVALRMPSDEELAEIILEKFPLLQNHIPSFMDVYRLLRHGSPANATKPALNFDSMKPFGLQALLRWSRRVQSLLSDARVTHYNQAISEAMNDDIFLEAIDCFLGAYPPGPQKESYIKLVSQGLNIPSERVRYCLSARKPTFIVNDERLQVGRTALEKRKKAHRFKANDNFAKSPFAVTDHVARYLEVVAVAVKHAEPCLLVGETGTGKTTILQHLADAMGRNLLVVNLSQQSEVGDLLGGYKPVNMRALAVPMKDEFEDLLNLMPNTEKNRPYLETQAKLVSKGRWAKVLVLWQDAVRTVDTDFHSLDIASSQRPNMPNSKRRKVQSSGYRDLRSRWDRFASDVQVFQRHLASGSKGFAFSFVEGKIVKAARNGQWVLLDEINLASPDTLESLSDLFSPATDGSPSLMLTESGESQRILANKDFRIFGAMNPATDVGKRNLPPSLRCRFTEIFVDGVDHDLDNLVAVVKVYLGNHQHLDVRAATDAARLYVDIQKFVNDNKLVDGAKQRPHYSLRNLTRVLVYALDTCPVYGLRRALFEGFLMGFLTILDQDSALLMESLITKHILGHQKNKQAFLRQTLRLPQDGRKYVQFRNYWIAQGNLEAKEQINYIITPFIERNLLNLVRAMSTRRFPILLQGPTSSGKTSMIEYLAKLSGNAFVRINNHEHTDLQEYLGTYVSGPDGNLRYQDGTLVHALREGAWVVLDELNLAPTDVLEALNRLLDDNRELFIPETQQVVTPHPNFMLFATQNPPGVYGGRKNLSRAFRNRFLELHFDDIPETELETILCERSQIAPSFCARIVAVYKRLSNLRQSDRIFEQKNSFATLRDLFRWALRKADDREQLGINGFLLLAERVRNLEERFAVKTIIEDVMRIRINEDKLYGTALVGNNVDVQGAYPKDIVWTFSMRRLFLLVKEALKNNEPVLLVGETGSGKTTICQVIAEMIDTKLNIVNAHQNLETGDIIGAQRPVRNRDTLLSKLNQKLTTVLKDQEICEENHEHTLPQLLEMYLNLHLEHPDLIPKDRHLDIETSKIKANQLFEWADGSLVTAMRNGEFFLLDEISLADDSVLERLNSVLELDRTLYLAEKGVNSGPLKAAPGFQFLATMNPGGDYGKRELSPALRNRFTEIWVPNVSAEKEMLEIVQAKLIPHIPEFPKSMVTFAAWFSATFNVAAPHISIRDLLSWVHFVNICHSDPWLGLVHGAAMVYVDSLGTNPASKMSSTNFTVSQGRAVCLSKLSDIFGHDLSLIYNMPYSLQSNDTSLEIGPFNLKKMPKAKTHLKYSLQAPTTTANALKLIRALQLKKPILIEGSPGVGKTTLVSALASAINMPLTRINLSDQTDLMDLFGSDSPLDGADAGGFGWRNAPFLRAMRRGEWVLLDEMNLASQSVLEGLNACLDHRGQVYISELDHVFEKHPRFVVFAAQNPHQQGGGRKGLPASFANRFTVVYAEHFTEEDLKIIARELYPEANDMHVERVVHMVTELDKTLKQNQNIEAHGGPWEINLRDVLRWLHLLTSSEGFLPLAHPIQLQGLNVLQRFRNPDDTATASKSLQHAFPETQDSAFFYGKCTSLIQNGLALLPRNQEGRVVSNMDFRATQLNLAIAESVMLCIQNCWPCLLVGASGTGKSCLISRLAESVGADLLEIPLSSDMDTMDLIGGFEQVDNQRDLTDFVKRLRAMIRHIMFLELQTVDGISEETISLEAELKNSKIDFNKISQSIHSASKGRWGSEYADFLEESANLVEQDRNSIRGHFEWVDGILVKAIRRGKWVVLDNANLCNPSVLDRLNSLLEPEGFLSINEHRDADGSAKLVHPHKNFRLFLTMDPRHGELSRAMRNRSVELFMPSQVHSPSTEIFGSNLESTISRFELFSAFDWSSDDKNYLQCLFSIIFDHLSASDWYLCHRWEAQVMRGLIHMPTLALASFTFVIETFRAILDPGRTFVHMIKHVFEELEAGITAPAPGVASIQNVDPQQASEWTRLERSVISLKTGNFIDDATQPLASLLGGMGQYLCSSVDSKIVDEIDDPEGALQLTREVCRYLVDILDDAHSPNFDDDKFRAYLDLGRSLCARSSGASTTDNFITSVTQELSARLDAFDSAWQLSSGLCMQELWAMFRPRTAADTLQLESSRQVKTLADHFDTVKFSSGASVDELYKIEKLLVHIHRDIHRQATQNTDHLIDLQRTLEALKMRMNVSKVSELPYFKSEFEILCQHIRTLDPLDQNAYNLVSLLAGRPTQDLMEFGSSSSESELLSQPRRMTVASDRSMEMGFVRGILPMSMLQKLEYMGEVPLRSLRLLRTEIEVAARTIASSTKVITSNPLDTFFRTLKLLHEKIQPVLGLQDPKDNMTKIGHLLHRLGGKKKGVNSHEASVGHLCRYLESITDPEVFEEKVGTTSQSGECAIAASYYIRFFTGYLLSYVPDRPFDPALRPIIEHARHQKRKVALECKLRALRDFETVFSGTTSSYRIRLAEEDLRTLEVEPRTPRVARPEVSKAAEQQMEYNNIISSIILKIPGPRAIESAIQGQQCYCQDLELLRANIARAITRLEQNFYTYEDMNKPLVAMLSGLDTGLALALLAGVQAGHKEDTIPYFYDRTPLLSAGPAQFDNALRKGLHVNNPEALELGFHHLEAFASARSVLQDLDEPCQNTLWQVFHTFYESWKNQLSRDQRQATAQSSLYRYQGTESSNDEGDMQDFNDLFGETEHSSEEDTTDSVVQFEPKQIAQRLAQLQRQIFKTSERPSARILRLIRNTARGVSGLWHNQHPMTQSPVPPERMLSALILGLDESNDHLQGSNTKSRMRSFFTDSDLEEAAKLIQLTQKLQTRFTELQEAWPEHATIADVLRTSSELLDLRHIEPVAKLLTKAEQLHGYVHEWQVVASREYTAVALYDQLTELLISWRRLELSTWAQLLDMEDQKCYDNADAWWFIAYEAIIAAPLSLIHNEDHLEVYPKQLFEILADFLTSTSMGQFSHRLSMIGCFSSYVETLIASMPSMIIVHDTIANFRTHFCHYEAPVQECLQKGRQSLEKEVKEIILLASWKDTNINALRDSAKRSHHKLYKVVRKYRSLLGQPSKSIIDQGIPPQVGTTRSVSSSDAHEVSLVDASALELCRLRLPQWAAMPERFINSETTTQLMLSMAEIPSTAIDVGPYLNSFGTDLIDSMERLRDSTPSKTNKTNAESVSHLKVQKRKLYADTLKSIRRMGFRYNLSANTLSRQASSAVILSSSPRYMESSKENFNAAEHHFHLLLNKILQSRASAENHSEDLTHSEVGRSLGYLESMMSMIIKQRTTIQNVNNDIKNCSLFMRKIRNLWAPGSYTVKPFLDGRLDTFQRLQQTFKWLIALIEAASVIIEKHGKLGGTDQTAILSSLESWRQKLAGGSGAFGILPDLPTGLSSSQHEQTITKYEGMLQQFKRHLQLLIHENPGLRFVLKQLELWTDLDMKGTVENATCTNGEPFCDLIALQNRVMSTTDAVLTAVQRIEQTSLKMPKSDEQTGWLLQVEETLSGRLRDLHGGQITVLFSEVASLVSHISPDGGDDVTVAGALCAVAAPIFQQYLDIVDVALNRYLQFHCSLCELAVLLSNVFSQIVTTGFCNPAQDSAAQTEQQENLEGGTGLGEGEGAQDISEDIQDDEDLSQLTQEKTKERSKEDFEDQEGAVNMDQDELEGDVTEDGGSEEDDHSASDGEDNELDEESGSVDELDPSAVDEKLWDGKANDAEKEKQGSKSASKGEEDKKAAADTTAQQENASENNNEETSDINEEGAEEGEEVTKEEPEKLDSHAQQGKNLELPEAMDVGRSEDTDSDRDLGELGDMSDEEQEQTKADEEDQQDHNADNESLEGNPDAASAQSEISDAAKMEDNDIKLEDFPVDTEPSDDGMQEDTHRVIEDRKDDAAVERDNVAPSDGVGLDDNLTDQQNREEELQSQSQAQANKGDESSAPNEGNSGLEVEDGQSGVRNERFQESRTQDSKQTEDTPNEVFKKLGDALEQWHRQTRDIKYSSEQDPNDQAQSKDVNMTDQDFEHLVNEDAEGDTQALGAATNEEARALDDKALASETRTEAQDLPPPPPEESYQEGAENLDEPMKDVDTAPYQSENQSHQTWPSALIANASDFDDAHNQQGTQNVEKEEDINDMDIDAPKTHLEPPPKLPFRSSAEARRLWSHYETLTRDLSQSLTEQLRLILSPTLATKMRGDFRTGKRLNIKRIIPYIASNYKRDKIWMRRSIPSKRNYQIMLAVDDSKSMGESGSGQLAFESLALIAKSLSMLEVGEICIVGFGNEVRVAHAFDKPFSSEAGAQIFQNFGFQQTRTDIRKLVAESIALFRHARRNTFNAGAELWQLELIISDGVCEDHDTIRRLVRQAQEERIMIVFVIVDALLKGESIMDMSSAVFEPDENGETKLKVQRYLDGFPFSYYVVVGNVKDLPGVLAQALRQWFAEVVESG
ncbi:AAA ATPase midasin [Lecanora helva]